MESSPQQRLDVIFQTYCMARDQRAADMAEAQSDAEADAIRANVNALDLAYLKAERAGLEANGAAVEAAYQAAKSAADQVAAAYGSGRELAERIRAVSGAVTAFSSLISKGAAVV